jgi:hypothetical protein
MNDEMRPGEAAQALTEIGRRQQQVIDLAAIPAWYWWTVGALMVVLAAGIDNRTSAAIGTCVCVFVIGMLSATGLAVARPFRHAQLRDGLLDGRGVLAILAFVALIVGGTLGIAFTLRAAGAPYPATLACLAGGLAMGVGGPLVTRVLRQIMLGNRTGSTR